MMVAPYAVYQQRQLTDIQGMCTEFHTMKELYSNPSCTYINT